MRTIHIRDIFDVQVSSIDNGKFVLELRYPGPEDRPYAQRKICLHFSDFSWVGYVAEQLWKVVQRRRQQFEIELKNAETSLKGP